MFSNLEFRVSDVNSSDLTIEYVKRPEGFFARWSCAGPTSPALPGTARSLTLARPGQVQGRCASGASVGTVCNNKRHGIVLLAVSFATP
jgi:hypothetical protein